MTPQDKLPTTEEIIHEACKPYGGFVNVINKAGGSTVMMLLKKAMEQYALELTKENERLRKERDSYKSSMLSCERFRMEDAASALDEENRLREKIASLSARLKAYEDGELKLSKALEKTTQQRDKLVKILKRVPQYFYVIADSVYEDEQERTLEQITEALNQYNQQGK